MNHFRTLAGALATSALLAAAPAQADDLVKMTIGQRGNWDTAVTHLGEKAGIFKKHGITMEMLYTSGSGETVQPVVSGNVFGAVQPGSHGRLVPLPLRTGVCCISVDGDRLHRSAVGAGNAGLDSARPPAA